MSDVKCAYCGANGDTVLHRDHVVPRSRGGPDNATNIVMACRPCNSAKQAKTATEWLGNRCPAEVREIEDRVNRKLKKEFSKRDHKPFPNQSQPPLYAFHQDPKTGDLTYIGKVLAEHGGILRLEAADPLIRWAGYWQLTGALYDLPRNECHLFNDLDACCAAADRCAARAETR